MNDLIRFADPFTWVLQDFPTVVPCSKVMPIRWRILNKWYCAVPDALLCEQPLQLNASVRFPTFQDFTIGVGQSAFTSRQIEAHAAFQRAFMARDAVIQQITNNAVEGSHVRGRLGMPLGKEDLADLENQMGSAFFPLFDILGAAWPYVSAILTILVLLAGLVVAVGRVIYVYSRRGCGLWLLPAIFQTTFTLFTVPIISAIRGIQQRNQQNFAEYQEEMEENGRPPYYDLAREVAYLLRHDRRPTTRSRPPTVNLDEQHELPRAGDEDFDSDDGNQIRFRRENE